MLYTDGIVPLVAPEKHNSRKRDDNLRLSAPRLGNGNASISAALASVAVRLGTLAREIFFQKTG